MVSHFPLSNSTVEWCVIIIYTYQRMFFALVNRCLVKDLRELKFKKGKKRQKKKARDITVEAITKFNVINYNQQTNG